MSLREVSSTLCRFARREVRPITVGWRSGQRNISKDAAGNLLQTSTRSTAQSTPIANAHTHETSRHASSQAAAIDASEDYEDLEQQSSVTSTEIPEDFLRTFDPVERARGRRRELPPSRYQFRPPRYYRGPLHPNQPPKSSDPASRDFVPGPFSSSRLEETYKTTIAQDLLTLGYVHKPPGTVETPKADRLRTWEGESPYFKGRPKRGPRGPGHVLRLVEKDIDFNNIPRIDEITVHCMVKGATIDSSHLHVAGMLLQTVTGVRAQVHLAKHSVSQWGIRRRMPISLTCTIRDNQALEFLDKCITLVLPRIKDWQGVEGTSGDSSGNISFGISREASILFPEVEVNYDMYPPRLIPGFHVTVKTTATSDRHARMLLTAMGIPFYGKYVD